MAKRSATREILRYMNIHEEGITQKQATEIFGVTRLSAIVFELKKQGYDIRTVMVEGKNRYGNKTKWARYVLNDKIIDHVQDEDGNELYGEAAIKAFADRYNMEPEWVRQCKFVEDRYGEVYRLEIADEPPSFQ